jgi:Restriction endonuclease
MAALDFREIAQANHASGSQDSFELFTRDFLEFLGYKIVLDPSRGPDGGKDVVVEEKRTGVGGDTIIKWLVSCKHNAHSGRSVNTNDDANICDRVAANKCDGFIGVYSTLPSTGLSTALTGLKDKMEAQVFDCERIEGRLLSNSNGQHLARRYFPASMSKWARQHPKVANIFTTSPTLKCKNCGFELLSIPASGIVVAWIDHTKNRTEEFYWCCKGKCDQHLAHQRRNSGFTDEWEDIPDVAIPLVFTRWIMSPLNELHGGHQYSEQAFEALKQFILSVYPFVAREATDEEVERIRSLSTIPAALGGLGY